VTLIILLVAVTHLNQFTVGPSVGVAAVNTPSAIARVAYAHRRRG